MTCSFHKMAQLSALEWHAVMTLRSRVFVVEQQCAYQDPDTRDLSAWHARIHDSDNTLISYCRLVPEGETMRIGRVVTAPEYRGKGSAAELMRACIQFVRDQPEAYSAIILSAQTHLFNFYAQLGFACDHAHYLEDFIPHVDMRMIIN
jgi:ElaA protein